MNITANPQLPPEVHAYAMARYSRSARSMAESVADITEQQAAKALDTYYNQYGHASIADMAHVSLSIEGVSLLAAIDIVDEPLWDGQERSTRYQDFGIDDRGYFPASAFDSSGEQTAYITATSGLWYNYGKLTEMLPTILSRHIAKPDAMPAGQYERAIKARAFDVARNLLPLETKTSLGQITSARTLSSQISRLAASDYAEIRQVAEGMRAAGETVAPTLLRHCEPDGYGMLIKPIVKRWIDNAGMGVFLPPEPVTVTTCHGSGISLIATAVFLHDKRNLPYRYWVKTLMYCDPKHEDQLLADIAAARGPHAPLPRWFRSAPFAFDILTDIGAYRDLHRHRRTHQFRQPFSAIHGFEPAESVFPKALGPAAQPALDAGLGTVYDNAIAAAHRAYQAIAETSPEAATYLLPLATRCRSLFKMDLAEAVYITETRTKPQGHYSYRWIAWEMAQAVISRYPEFAPLFRVTDPREVDLLAR